jgi:hypothetical protein
MFCRMSSVQQIQIAIQELPETEYQELAWWWDAHQERFWDEKLARDSKPGGRLENFLREVDADIDAGNVTAIPR